MDAHIHALQAQCRELLARVDSTSEYDRLRAVYMDLAPLMGEIHGVVMREVRRQGDTPATGEAQAAMESLRAAARQVGLDIRLASPAALALGLRTSLELAQRALQALDKRTS